MARKPPNGCASHSEYRKQLRLRHKAKGECVKCGNPAEPGLTRCAKCNIRHRADEAKGLRRAMAENRCIRCRKPNDRPEMTKCSRCSDLEKVGEKGYRPILRKRRTAEGKCATCGRPLTMGETTIGCRLCNGKGDYNFTWN